MAYVVDTNIVLELMKKDPDPHVLDWARDHNEEAFLTTITLMELQQGIVRMNGGKRKDNLENAIQAIAEECIQRIYDYDVPSALCCAALSYKAEELGFAPRLSDCMIAAICQRNNAVLVTHSVKDFELYGIKLVDPWDYESPISLAARQRELDRAKQMAFDLPL